MAQFREVVGSVTPVPVGLGRIGRPTGPLARRDVGVGGTYGLGWASDGGVGRLMLDTLRYESMLVGTVYVCALHLYLHSSYPRTSNSTPNLACLSRPLADNPPRCFPCTYSAADGLPSLLRAPNADV